MNLKGFAKIDRKVVGRISEIGATPFAVLCVMVAHSDDAGRSFPSVETIARIVGCSKPTVKRAIRVLKGAGMIHQQRRKQSTSIYTIQEVSPVIPQGDKRDHQRSLKDQEVSPVTPRGITSDPQEVSPVTPRTRARTNDTQLTRKGRAAAKEIELPKNLDTDRFRESWDEWISYRRERKLTLTPRTIKGQLKKLAAWGEDGACESIDQSIVNGWQGLFKPKHGANGNGRERYAAGNGQRHPDDRNKF